MYSTMQKYLFDLTGLHKKYSSLDPFPLRIGQFVLTLKWKYFENGLFFFGIGSTRPLPYQRQALPAALAE